MILSEYRSPFISREKVSSIQHAVIITSLAISIISGFCALLSSLIPSLAGAFSAAGFSVPVLLVIALVALAVVMLFVILSLRTTLSLVKEIKSPIKSDFESKDAVNAEKISTNEAEIKRLREEIRQAHEANSSKVADLVFNNRSLAEKVASQEASFKYNLILANSAIKAYEQDKIKAQNDIKVLNEQISKLNLIVEKYRLCFIPRLAGIQITGQVDKETAFSDLNTLLEDIEKH